MEQQIFGEDDPADEICWVAAGMRRLRTDGQQEQILVIVVVGADTTVVVGADTTVVVGADTTVVVGADTTVVVGEDTD